MHGGVLGECVRNGLSVPWQGGLATHPAHPEVGSVASTGEASGSRGPPRGPGDGRDVLLQRTPRGLVLWQRRVTRGTNARDSPQPSREMPHTCEGPGAPRRTDGPSRSLPGFLSRPHPCDAVPGWALTPASPSVSASVSAPSVVARTPLSGFSRCPPAPGPGSGSSLPAGPQVRSESPGWPPARTPPGRLRGGPALPPPRSKFPSTAPCSGSPHFFSSSEGSPVSLLQNPPAGSPTPVTLVLTVVCPAAPYGESQMNNVFLERSPALRHDKPDPRGRGPRSPPQGPFAPSGSGPRRVFSGPAATSARLPRQRTGRTLQHMLMLCPCGGPALPFAGKSPLT